MLSAKFWASFTWVTSVKVKTTPSILLPKVRYGTQRIRYHKPSVDRTHFSIAVKFLSTLSATAVKLTSTNLFEMCSTGRPTSKGSKLSSLVVAGVKRRTQKCVSKKIVPTSDEFKKLAKSSLVWPSSSTFSLSWLLTVTNSSLMDCSSSFEVSNSSLVDWSSSLIASTSSLAAVSSSLEVWKLSLVA